MSAIGLLGIIASLILFAWLSYKGVHTYIAIVPAAILCILANGLPLQASFADVYWPNFLAYIKRMWWIALGGSMFGSLILITGGGITIARAIIKLLGKNSTIGITLIGIVLELCGVSLFAGSIFIMLPIIFEIYKKYDIPRRFCVSMLCFSALTLACVTPGSTMMHNLIPAYFFGLPLYHGFIIGITCMVFMLVIGQMALNRLIRKAQANGEHFVPKSGDFTEKKEGEEEHLPPLWRVVIPMICYPLLINISPLFIFFNQLIALLIGAVLLWGYYSIDDLLKGFRTTIPTGLGIIFAQSAVMGFGSILASAPSFAAIATAITKIPGPVYVQVAISTTTAAAMCGSASGGINIMLPIMGKAWAASGASLSGIARTCGLSSLVFDSMPYNGAINAMVNGCGETLKSAYHPIFWMTVIIPFCGTVLMVLLYTILPMLP